VRDPSLSRRLPSAPVLTNHPQDLASRRGSTERLNLAKDCGSWSPPESRRARRRPHTARVVTWSPGFRPRPNTAQQPRSRCWVAQPTAVAGRTFRHRVVESWRRCLTSRPSNADVRRWSQRPAISAELLYTKAISQETQPTGWCPWRSSSNC